MRIGMQATSIIGDLYIFRSNVSRKFQRGQTRNRDEPYESPV